MQDQNRHPLLYDELARVAKAVSPHKAFRIANFGVFDGLRLGTLMKKARAAGRNNVELYGFDLFEDMTEEKNAQEIGKRTLAPSFQQAQINIRKFGQPNKLKLYKGDSVSLLPKIIGELPPMDLVFVDGGHSVDTIKSDAYHAFLMTAGHGSVVFDDVYKDDLGKGAWFLIRAMTEMSGRPEIVVSPPDVTPVLRISTAAVRGKNYRKLADWVKSGQTLWVREEKVTVGDLELEATGWENSEVLNLKNDKIYDSLPAVDNQALSAAVMLAYSRSMIGGEGVSGSAPNQAISEKKNDPGTGGGDPDVRELEVRADGGGEPVKDAEDAGDGGGRREPGLEPEKAPEGSGPGPDSPAPLPEERPEPDPQLELGGGEGGRAEDTVHGGGEQRPEVSDPAPAEPAAPGPDVVESAKGRPGPGRPGPRRSSDKRSGA